MRNDPRINRPLVYVSVLNWNGAEATLACLAALLATEIESVDVRYVVVDNGSSAEDRKRLREGCSGLPTVLVENERNLGFAGGHNAIIERAIGDGADYIWLVNNDCLVTPDTLAALYALISTDTACGVVSPMIVAQHDNAVIDFCGAVHDWQKLDSVCAPSKEEGQLQYKQRSADFFVYGTVPLIRVEALRVVGLLNNEYFAYYEDDDFCTRLSRAGWSIQMEFDTVVHHCRHKSYLDDKPPYFFYLMARNSMFFYVRYTPKPYRRFIRLRLAIRSMILAQKFLVKGYPDKANACLRGALDGLLGISGPPRTNVPTPKWFSWLARSCPYRFQRWLETRV